MGEKIQLESLIFTTEALGILSDLLEKIKMTSETLDLGEPEIWAEEEESGDLVVHIRIERPQNQEGLLAKLGVPAGHWQRAGRGVYMTLLDGPYTGSERLIWPGELELDELFASIIEHGWHWECDYSLASEEEMNYAFSFEFEARVAYAIQENRPIKFLNKTYIAENGESEDEIFNRVLGDLASSKRLLLIESDTQDGLVIGVGDHTQ
ncbi:MAG: hypothetical protein WC120_00320 [Parcubacteria group bacterium]